MEARFESRDIMRHRIIGLGEVLWDIFPDGEHFGGAPANFACTAAALGRDRVQAFVVSRVGRDELGRRALETLRKQGVDTSCLNVSDTPTGQVHVRIDAEGHARYEFASRSAWDELEWTPRLEDLARAADVVCFGSLGQRSERSRATIRSFVEATVTNALRILDVNLRPPFDDDAVVLDSLALANIVKLNEDELPRLAEMCRLTGSEVDLMRSFARRFDLHAVALTRGADGAVVVRAEEVCEQESEKVEVVDTVGAGDAFTASLALGLRAGDDLPSILRRACRVAAFVCTQAGATPVLPRELTTDT